MDNKLFTEILCNLIYIVLVCTIPIITKYIVMYLRSKKEEIEANAGRDAFSETLCTAISLIQNVVDKVSQTYVDSLKQSGKFDEKCQKEAFEKALEESKLLLDSGSKEVLESVFSDLDSWIGVQIESYIKSKKI